MASCLLDCLCEAELQKYYPHFVSVGLHTIEDLAEITMKDYSSLGVHNMEDRKRLFQLIKIIQSVSADKSETPLQPGCVYLHPMKTRSGPRRQLHFDSSSMKDNRLFDSSELSGLSNNNCTKHKGEQCETALPADPDYNATFFTVPLDTNATCTAKSNHAKLYTAKDRATSLGDHETPVIHRVAHVSGYNYGVPQTCLRSNTSEKEASWTETDKIRVCVRKRPLGLREERRGEMNVVTVEDKETISIYEKKEAVNLKEYILQHIFYFDEVFSEDFSNHDVYMKTAHPLIQHVFNGGNATCFAYGQTGAGKTYTMIGTQKNPGLYALAAKDIFQQLESVPSRKDHFVLISFYEIYCGQLYDLLNGRKRLFAREDGKHVVQIVGLREVQVSGVDLLLEMIQKGSRERSTGATGVNSDSSRSHAIIQIQIKDAARRKLGRMSFIDLAGSERASDARESNKQTKMEGAEINQSLLALKECIRALDQEQAHTPFRQSKLTQVLKDSFIGNSKTCMIANVSPSHVATEHTLNTLRYADRVKELKRGIKCSSSCLNRVRSDAPASPKRVQNSLSTLGEKVSPKKVKLGLQINSTSCSAKPKTYPSVFYPANIPLSSTPKFMSKTAACKGNLSHVWLGHTTPIKGIVKSENNGKKKTEEQSFQYKNAANKNSSVKSEPVTETRDDQQNKIQTGLQQTVLQRSIQPVQKQIVSRCGLVPGKQNYKPPSDCTDSDSVSRQTDIHFECWTSNLPQQKEREQHLRYYHQQFQQPPILQQKLECHPLRKTMNQYKVQEVRIESGSPTSGSPNEERVRLEDLDDSDFSEDSFSYASNPKERRKEVVREKLSFFLHQESPGTENRKVIEREPQMTLVESHKGNQNFSWGYDDGSGFSVNKEQIAYDNYNERKNLWNSVDSSSAFNLSEVSNTPEKPYSSHENITHSVQKVKYSSEIENMERKNVINSLSKLQEQSDRSDCIMVSKASEKDRMNVLEETAEQHCDEVSVSAIMAPLSVSLLQDNWSVESPLSAKSEHRAKYLNSKGVWSLDSAGERSTDKSPGENVSEIVKHVLRYNKSLNLHNSPSGLLQEWDDPDHCNSLGSSQDNKGLLQEENLGLSGCSTNNSVNVRDTSLAFVCTAHDHLFSQYYDADTEETTDNMTFFKSTPKVQKLEGTKSIDSFEDSFMLPIKDSELEHLKNKLMKYMFAQKNAKEPLSCSENAVTQKSPRIRPSIDSPTSALATLSPHARAIERARQLVVQAHREQINEMTALCTREELLLNQMPNSDFKEYVAKLDEIMVQKSNCIQSLRSQLKLFMAYPLTDGSTESASST
ncbi:kinesin-like protein KIF24 [Bombina bombina]|uniref:kinesin-like protein KIF24 n=1 Tax=Bombina bombina TaxID=8345 RepID=UPI00235AA0B0|nr:kinesin-like protein KIF24 [Bombina bombina]